MDKKTRFVDVVNAQVHGLPM